MKKIVYLISPNKINNAFIKNLDSVLSYGNVKYFQLRLKQTSLNKIFQIALRLRKITKKNKVKLIINDNYKIAKKVKADGCHLGQSDSSIVIARKTLKNKIIGVTCHNSIFLAERAFKEGADYVALGAFFKSKLKPHAKRAYLKTLRILKKKVTKKIVAIGGINNKNYKKLIKLGVNYIAISSYIWDNPNLKPSQAIKQFI